MSKSVNPERGQALVLIMLGIFVLIGMAGLAVDGGSGYSERRHAQNAADTAVMAAGLSRIRNPLTCGDPTSTTLCAAAYDAAMLQALDNGYDNATSNTVDVVQCNDPAANCALPPSEPYVDNNPPNGQYDAGETYTDTNGNGTRDRTVPVEFVQVKISSEVPTYFARVLGITTMTNTVEALVKAVPPMPTNWYNGRALVSLMPGCKPGGWPSDPFVVGGNSVSLINGSGVYVNSDCDPAFTDGGGSNSMTVTSGGICVRGTSGGTTGINPPPTENCAAEGSTQLYQMPPVDDTTCNLLDLQESIQETSPGIYEADPGRYNLSFPGAYVGPGSKIFFNSGVYCLYDGFTLSSNWNDVTTDMNEDGTFDGSDGTIEGAMFYVAEGGVTFNGGSTLHLGAMNNPTTQPAIKGYLLYLPPTNNSTVSLSGSNGTSFVGTILAPSSHIDIDGNTSATTINFQAQIIGYSINLTGSGTLNMNYFQSQNGAAWTSPVLKLYR